MISSVDFVNEAFLYSGIELEWSGEGVNEKAIVKSVDELMNHIKPGNILIEINENYFRPSDVNNLQADITKAKKILNWKPRVTFKDFVKIMVDCDFIDAGLKPIGDGINIFKQKDFTYTNHARQATYAAMRQRTV